MPEDKFGSPFFYPTRTNGFFMQQLEDSKNDPYISDLDSSFSVNNGVITMKCSGPTSFSIGRNTRKFTGSKGGCNMDFAAVAKSGWAAYEDDVRDIEFKCWMKVPSNLSSGHDGFSMSVCTGKHSSDGCCQSFTYMGSLEGINSNPTKFRFRKETTHPNYQDSSEGTWSHPKCNFKVAGHDYIGFGFCRYNKPTSGGTSPQDDSVVLEIWFNPDPQADPKDWTMLKRTEDKRGRKWTNQANKCNGDADQIGVWSNAHNRLKSNSTSGTILFKSISFREIDPFGTFDNPPSDGGGTPPPDDGTGGGTGNTSTIQFAFALQSDINLFRTTACAGTGISSFYDHVTADLEKKLSDSATWANTTRIGEKVGNSSSPIRNKIIKQVDASLKVLGAPGASPTVSCKIWDSRNNVVYTSPTTIDPTTLTTSFVFTTFDFSTNTHVMTTSDIVGVEWTGTSTTDLVVTGYEEDPNQGNQWQVQYEGTSWVERVNRDWAAVLYN